MSGYIVQTKLCRVVAPIIVYAINACPMVSCPEVPFATCMLCCRSRRMYKRSKTTLFSVPSLLNRKLQLRYISTPPMPMVPTPRPKHHKRWVSIHVPTASGPSICCSKALLSLSFAPDLADAVAAGCRLFVGTI